MYRIRRLNMGCNVDGSDVGENYVLAKKTTIIGRAFDADITINSTSNCAMISRRHAVIEETEKDGRIVHLLIDESVNGTYVNEYRLAKGMAREIKLGDIIKFGHANGSNVKQNSFAPQLSEFTFLFEEVPNGRVEQKNASDFIKKETIDSVIENNHTSQAVSKDPQIGRACNLNVPLSTRLCTPTSTELSWQSPNPMGSPPPSLYVPSIPSYYTAPITQLGQSYFPAFWQQHQWAQSNNIPVPQFQSIQTQPSAQFCASNQDQPVKRENVWNTDNQLNLTDSNISTATSFATAFQSNQILQTQTATTSYQFQPSQQMNSCIQVPSTGLQGERTISNISHSNSTSGAINTQLESSSGLSVGCGPSTQSFSHFQHQNATIPQPSFNNSLCTSTSITCTSQTENSESVKMGKYEDSTSSASKNDKLTDSYQEPLVTSRSEASDGTAQKWSSTGFATTIPYLMHKRESASISSLDNLQAIPEFHASHPPAIKSDNFREEISPSIGFPSNQSTQGKLIQEKEEQMKGIFLRSSHCSPKRRGHGHSESSSNSRSGTPISNVTKKTVKKRTKMDETTRLLLDLTDSFHMLTRRPSNQNQPFRETKAKTNESSDESSVSRGRALFPNKNQKKQQTSSKKTGCQRRGRGRPRTLRKNFKEAQCEELCKAQKFSDKTSKKKVISKRMRGLPLSTSSSLTSNSSSCESSPSPSIVSISVVGEEPTENSEEHYVQIKKSKEILDSAARPSETGRTSRLSSFSSSSHDKATDSNWSPIRKRCRAISDADAKVKMDFDSAKKIGESSTNANTKKGKTKTSYISTSNSNSSSRRHPSSLEKTKIISDSYTTHTPEQRCSANSKCKLPNKENLQWICCDVCRSWYHAKCVSLGNLSNEQLEKLYFECSNCSQKELAKKRRKKKTI